MITINNYEDYFLRYTDAELSVEEMEMVQAFVVNHPHLQEELDALMDTRLSSDEIETINVDFSSLLKNEKKDEVTVGALIELLHNELDQPSEIEAQINASEILRDEWTLLLKTKLEDEIVIFNDKQSLYKEERNSSPVIYMWRIAAAAVFVGLMLLGGYKFFTKDADITTEFVNTELPVKDTLLAKKKMIASTNETSDPNNIEELDKGNTALGETSQRKVETAKTTKLLVKETNTIESKKQQQYVKSDLPSQKVSIQSNNNKIVKDEKPNPIIASVERKEQSTNIGQKKMEIIDVDLSTVFADNATSMATAASYNDDETTVLYMKASKLKDSKLGMAFGKLKKAVKAKIGLNEDEINLKPIQINLK